MTLALIIAWTLRTALLLLWVPVAMLAEIIRVVRSLDRWSSELILAHKAETAASAEGKLYLVRPVTQIARAAH